MTSFRLQASSGPPLEVAGDPDLVAEVAGLWSAFDAGPAGAAGGAEGLLLHDRATASAEVNRLLVARLPHPAVHAGAVASVGGAIAFPARSGLGKSTLTAALCLAGASYLSDEALVLDGTDSAAPPLVLPYPKPVALSPWSAVSLGLGTTGTPTGDLTPDGDRELLFTPDRLGPTSGPLPLAHLLLPERVDGRPWLRPVHRREGLAALLELSFNHYRDPRRFLRVAAAAVQGAQVHRLGVGDPRDTAALVVDRLR